MIHLLIDVVLRHISFLSADLIIDYLIMSAGTVGSTYFVSMRMSAFAGSRTALQISSCVTGMDLFIDTHKSDR